MSARFGLILVVLTATAGAIPVPDPPPVMVGGPHTRNLANTTDRNIPADWAITQGLRRNVKWQTRLGSMSFGRPVVADGKVFVGTNNDRPRDPNVKGDRGVMMCFDSTTGEFLWQIAHEKLNVAIDAPKCGIASAPVVEAGRLYYVSNRCELVCAETTQGGILWSLDMIAAVGVYPGGISGSLSTCSPLLIDDLVVVCTSNGVDDVTRKPKNPDAPSLIAVNKATGKVVWQDASPGADIMDGQWSSPAAARIDGAWQVIYAGGDGWLRGHEAKSGKVLWKCDLNPKGLVFNSAKRDSKNYVVATPVVYDNKVYVAVGQEPDAGNGIGHLWCINPARKPTNDELDLSPTDNDFDPASAKNKNSGLVWHHGGAIVPKPPAGVRQNHFGRTISTVAVHDGVVYAAELEGYIQALDAATGKKLWEDDLKDATWSSPYYVDGKVFIGTDSGELHVYQAGRVRRPLGTIDMEQSLKVPPTVASGVLYITNGLHLYAIQAR